MAESNPTVHITNQYTEALNVFKLTIPADASADNKDSLYGEMLQVSTVAANAKLDYVPSELLETLYFVRQSDRMPLACPRPR